MSISGNARVNDTTAHRLVIAYNTAMTRMAQAVPDPLSTPVGDYSIAASGPTYLQAHAFDPGKWLGLHGTEIAYSVGDVVFSEGSGAGLVLECTTAGTSAPSAPSFNTSGTTSDGTATWTTLGVVDDLAPVTNFIIGAAVSAPSWTWTSVSQNVSLDNRFGVSFTVGGSDIVVSSLGYFAASSGGETENVRIHRNSDGALIAEQNIVGSQNEWVDSSITPVTLSAGTAYTVSHRAGGASRSVYRNPTGLEVALGISINNYAFGSNDNRPTSSTSNAYAAARFNF